MWATDGSPELKTDADSIICTSTKRGDISFNAMWTDEVNSGEHYWVIKFSDLEGYAAVGLTNKDRFKPGYGLKGMYGGNLHNGGALLVQNYGPGLKSNDTIGLLVSFTSRPPNVQIFFFQNGQPLGLAFDVPATILPNACPVIRFGKKGSGKISKEINAISIPTNRIRSPEQYSGIEGPWKILQNSIQIDGKTVEPFKHFDPYGVTMIIKKGSGGDDKNKFSVHLTVVNYINFTIQRSPSESTWTSGSNGGMSTLMGGSAEMMKFERKISDLCQHPESASLDNEVLKIVKGSSKASFTRYDDSPKPFTGSPFN